MTEESSFGSRAATLSGARELLDLERSEEGPSDSLRSMPWSAMS